MSFKNMKIGARLGLGFGFLLVIMGVLVTVGAMRLTTIGEINEKIIGKDWVKADAANTINATTKANARRTMELFFATDKEQVAKINQRIEANKKTIGAALETLDKLVYAPEGKALMAKIKEARGGYVTSFNKTAKLLEEGKREEASKNLMSETLPAIDILQGHVVALTELQVKLVNASGAEAKQTIESARELLVAAGLIALVVCIGFAYWVTRSITRPLKEAVTVAEAVAGGDFTCHIETTAKDETGRLLMAMGQMVEKLRDVMQQIRTSSEAVSAASQQIATGNSDLSQRTEEQASSLEETASSMEQLTATVKQNAENAKQANQLAIGASDVAVKGGQVVGEVVDTMSAINASSKKIADIISVIDGIAFQTNILALNAAVEAARAGEQGRGFAVVASEVRNLAQRSAAAAKEIKGLIGDSVEKVESGSKLVAQAGETIDEVVLSVKRVTDIMAEITAASLEQSSGIEQVNQAVVQMDQVTQQNAALVEEAAAAAESMEEQARALAAAVAVFKLNEDARMLTHATLTKAASAPVEVLPEPAKPTVQLKTSTTKLPAQTAEDEWKEF